MSEHPFVPYSPYVPPTDPLSASRQFFEVMDQRRSVRFFSDRDVDQAVIENIIRTASTAPSGAHKQPWRFVAVRSADLKREIRHAAEEEEKAFYAGRASDRWLQDLAHIGTDDHKPYLETAPWLIIVFKLTKDDNPRHESDQIYYLNESVGIATGMLISAIHMAGLVTLTHTPSPMKFLAEVLRRPDYERPFLLLPVGYPSDDCVVPDLVRKPLDEVMVIDRPEPGV